MMKVAEAQTIPWLLSLRTIDSHYHVIASSIPCAYAAEKLEILVAANKRLPQDKIVVRLQK